MATVIQYRRDSWDIVFELSLGNGFKFTLPLRICDEDEDIIGRFITSINCNETDDIRFGYVQIDFDATTNEFDIWTDEGAGGGVLSIQATEDNKLIIKDIMNVMREQWLDCH